jgi:hypothetical protein
MSTDTNPQWIIIIAHLLELYRSFLSFSLEILILLATSIVVMAASVGVVTTGFSYRLQQL